MVKAEIYVISELNKGEMGNIGLKYAASVEEAKEESIHFHGTLLTLNQWRDFPKLISEIVSKNKL